MGRALKTGLLSLLSLITLVVMGLFIFRHPLLEAVISNQLNKLNFPLQSIESLDLSFNALQLQGLVAGNNRELRLNDLAVTWDLSDLLAGKPVKVAMDGLHMTVDLSKLPSRDSMPPMAATSESNVTIPRLPIVSITDTVIHLHAATGKSSIAISGNTSDIQTGGQSIQLKADISGNLARSDVTLTAAVDPKGNIQGKLLVADGQLNLPEARISSFGGEASFAFTALQLQHLQTKLTLAGVHLPINIAPEKPASSQGNGESAAFAFRDAALDNLTLSGDIRQLSDSWQGEIDLTVDGGQFTSDALNFKQLAITLPIRASLKQNHGTIALRNPAQISLGEINTSYPVDFKNSPQLTVAQADIEITRNPQGFALTHEITLSPGKVGMLVKRPDSAGIEVRLHPGTLALTGKLDDKKPYQGEFTLSGAALSLPQSQLQLKAISATLYLNDKEIGHAADFAIGQLRHLAPEPVFSPLAIAGNVRNQAAAGKPPLYALNVTGGIDDLRFLNITGNYAPENANGMLTAKIAPLKFSPQGLQPGKLSPALAVIENVTGQIHANAQMKWSAQGIRSSHGTFKLSNMSFAYEDTTIDDLNIALDLADLLSLSSPPHQKITVKRIDSGIPLENLLVSYQIQNADSPRIRLEKTQFSIMNGTVSLVPTIIDPAAKRSDLLIRINDVDLDNFFNFIQVDGLTGSGRLDGQIPLTLEKNQVAITTGHLAAKTPGVLHFKSEKASQLLASAGDEMNLLLQALQNFHYSELSLHLDKSVTHDLVVKLSLLGNNPDVKDGRAFRLNINLETDIGKILQTINQGYNLSHEILQGSFRMH